MFLICNERDTRIPSEYRSSFGNIEETISQEEESIFSIHSLVLTFPVHSLSRPLTRFPVRYRPHCFPVQSLDHPPLFTTSDLRSLQFQWTPVNLDHREIPLLPIPSGESPRPMETALASSPPSKSVTSKPMFQRRNVNPIETTTPSANYIDGRYVTELETILKPIIFLRTSNYYSPNYLSLAPSLTHSLTHTFAHSHIHPLEHSPTRIFTYILSRSLHILYIITHPIPCHTLLYPPTESETQKNQRRTSPTTKVINPCFPHVHRHYFRLSNLPFPLCAIAESRLAIDLEIACSREEQ